MKTSCSISIILVALLLSAPIFILCSHSHKLKRSHGLPLELLEKTQPRDFIFDGIARRPLSSESKIQPKHIDDCDEEPVKPTGRDLSERRLSKKLGGSIDERFLSVSKPAHMSDSPQVERVSLRGITTSEKDFLRQVIRNETVPSMGGKVSIFMERFLMKWLIHKSDCPVEHTWTDQGICYWPRWISMGRCIAKQCSWPQGMSCVASDPIDVYLLRWNCRTNRNRRKGKKTGTPTADVTCRWLKFKRSVINDCYCKCDSARAD